MQIQKNTYKKRKKSKQNIEFQKQNQVFVRRPQSLNVGENSEDNRNAQRQGKKKKKIFNFNAIINTKLWLK